MYMNKHKERTGKCVAYIVLSHAPILATLVENGFGNSDRSNFKVYSKYCSSFEVFVKDNEEPKVPVGIKCDYMDSH